MQMQLRNFKENMNAKKTSLCLVFILSAVGFYVVTIADILPFVFHFSSVITIIKGQASPFKRFYIYLHGPFACHSTFVLQWLFWLL